MKKIAVIVLLISFSARPVYQLSYIAYFELNIDYIIEKYCVNKERPKLQCNGKCHLMKQLSLSETGSDEQKNHTATLVETFFPLYFQAYVYNIELFTSENLDETSWNISEHLNSVFRTVPSPPPKV